MLKNIVGFILTTSAVFIFGSCAGNPTQTTNTNAAAATPSPANSNSMTNAKANAAATANTASNAATSTNSNSISVGEVTRISFAKGATAGTAVATLAPDAAKQFAVEADYGQKIKVTTDSKSATVKMLSGTDRQVESAGGGLVLEVNARGDVLFEVKNTSAQELKTTVRVEITKGY